MNSWRMRKQFVSNVTWNVDVVLCVTIKFYFQINVYLSIIMALSISFTKNCAKSLISSSVKCW